ncbi:hypothetical protein [Calderihabitans maritimus]|uniref:Uncharacterized protein n=1 Tax=Calderihabitans maritimus TaxID=1246530 RepID=A0A1Z5HWD6_9FIRM|nr:hypothetical protein [Calderihabitans maritimus]GAW93849.1 hypothetical protein TherJR_2055 [Calderihabitans maritimus]
MADLAQLRRRRNHLIDEWVNAKENDKIKILVKIMDIDEQIEEDKKKSRKRNIM